MGELFVSSFRLGHAGTKKAYHKLQVSGFWCQDGEGLYPETPGPDLTLYESGIEDSIDIYCSE